mgnify:CR=1 FL=1
MTLLHRAFVEWFMTWVFLWNRHVTCVAPTHKPIIFLEWINHTNRYMLGTIPMFTICRITSNHAPSLMRDGTPTMHVLLGANELGLIIIMNCIIPSLSFFSPTLSTVTYSYTYFSNSKSQVSSVILWQFVVLNVKSCFQLRTHQPHYWTLTYN